ncbi:AAA family ATPase [Mesorhizobium sp. M0924]|uniref:AAA family ATPase n=1 Tax=unclassified Mesorhizobium TaxID=325217 RepID=UPI00333BE1CE
MGKAAVRRAEASENWEKLKSSKPFSSRLVRIEYSGIAGLFDGHVDFTSPITMVCGLNGVGKSLLLRLVWAALDWESGKSVAALVGRIANGKVTVSLTANNTPVTRLIDGSQLTVDEAIPDNVGISYVDAPKAAIELFNFFSQIESVDDILNGIDPIPLDDKDLATLKYITGKAYSEVGIFEIEGFDNIKPFFKVKEYNVEYDTKTMSLGEISCFYMLWLFRRAKAGSFYFIDEPETFVSPMAQSSMMDYIARVTLEKKLSVLLSSHSTRMMGRLSEQDLVLMFATPLGTKFYDRSKWRRFLHDMGMSSGKRHILFVEDRLARMFCRNLLSRFDLPLLAESELLDVGGEAVITELRKKFPIYAKDVKIVGIYDADIKVKGSRKPIWPFVKLPGEISVEGMFKDLVRESPQKVSVHLGREVEDIQIADAGAAGADMHDWMFEFASRLGFEFEVLVSVLTNAWLSEQVNETAAQEFVSEVRMKAEAAPVADAAVIAG